MVVTLTPLLDIPMVRPGDDVAGLLIRACEQAAPADHDVLAVAQKIVSRRKDAMSTSRRCGPRHARSGSPPR